MHFPADKITSGSLRTDHLSISMPDSPIYIFMERKRCATTSKLQQGFISFFC